MKEAGWSDRVLDAEARIVDQRETLRARCSAKEESCQIGNLGPYDRTEVIDEITFAIHLAEPFAPFPANLSSIALAPGSAAALEEFGEQFAQRPVGPAPFMVDRGEGNGLHLVKNPDHNWPPPGKDFEEPAYLDEIIIREVAESATRVVPLQTGEANMIHYPVFEEVSSSIVPGPVLEAG